MIGIMKDVESNGAGGQPVGNAKYQLQPAGFNAEHKHKRPQKPNHDNRRLAQQAWIAAVRIVPDSLMDACANSLQEFSGAVEDDTRRRKMGMSACRHWFNSELYWYPTPPKEKIGA